MKKMLKNQKGFSLIELLIVIAIMGVLAVIAFSMFSGVLANSKKNADERQAGNIQKALVAYMVDTNDTDLSEMETEGGTTVGTSLEVTDLILALQTEQTVNVAGVDKTFEPYLNPRTGGSPSSADFAPQWSGNGGYHVEIFEDRLNATVVPVLEGETGENTITIN